MIPLIPISRKPDITVHSSGRIDIRAHVAHLLKLEEGDVLDIRAADGECFIGVRIKSSERVGRHVGQVVSSSGKGNRGTLRIWSKQFAALLCLQSGVPCPPSLPLDIQCGDAVDFNGNIWLPIIRRYRI